MQHLYDLSKMAHDQYRQDAEKSSATVNNVATLEWSQSKQKLEAKSGRFQTRLTERNAVNLQPSIYLPLLMILHCRMLS